MATNPQPPRLVGSLLSGKKAVNHPVAAPTIIADEPPAWMKELIAAMKQLPAPLLALAQREPVQIKPAATPVQVNPQFQINTPTAWDVEITERDRNGRVSKISIKSAHHG